MRFVLVTLWAWLAGGSAYLVTTEERFTPGLLVYGTVFSALALWLLFALVLLPAFAWFRRRPAPRSWFFSLGVVASVGCAVGFQAVSPESTGLASVRALVTYAIFGIAGGVVGLASGAPRAGGRW